MFVAERRETDFDRIVHFFERLLRSDSKCRLADEYPLVFSADHSRVITINPHSENYLSGKLLGQFDDGVSSHILVFEERGELRAGLACTMRTIEVAAQQKAKFCFVGSVVTEPAYRQQGFQKELFHVLSNACFEAKVDFIALWSNQMDFYRKLGFSLGGLQASWTNGVPMKLADINTQVNIADAFSFKFDPRFFDLFSKKRMRVDRTKDEMELLFKIPSMKIFSTENAYALVGKGEDFHGVCHEWAGKPDEVMACLEAAWRENPELRILSPGVMHSPDEAEVIERLEKNAFENRLEYLALFRILNPQYQMQDLQPENLKYPFFIWGLDSI